ncbi:MAG: B12-binding domain-containing protein, partial [Alphaproteobacteria bacterium]|nr:B12-binding domain-containing protein [Alphaproteobacteria bacterium]
MSVAKIFDAVMEYEEEDVAELVQSEIDAGTEVKSILQDGLIAPLDEIGEKFSAGTLFVPEMLMAAEAVQAGLDILRPLLTETGVKPIGTVVLGTVKGDLHDIGKNLVLSMLKGT